MSQDDIALRECLEPHWFRVEARHYSHADEYGDHSYTSSELKIELIKVVRHTPKGAWLLQGFSNKRFVLRDYQHRARAYAAPTLEMAKEDFRKRKQYRIDRLQAQIHRAEREIALLGRSLSSPTIIQPR